MHNYLRAWKKFAVCRGRATQAEYWQFFLINMLIGYILFVMIPVSVEMPTVVSDIWFRFWFILLVLYSLAAIVPQFSVMVRRLHDTNRSGWWTLAALIPLVGPFVVFYYLVQDSQPGENRYGPNPKEVAA